MCLGEMEDTKLCYRANYSFTFTIPKNKTVYYKNKRMTYSIMSQDAQYNFLENHMQKIKKGNMSCYWVYEEHEDKRLHIHGFILNEYIEYIEQFRRDFYSWPIQISPKVYFRLSNIQETILDIHYFIDYMVKNENKIKYKMSSFQAFEEMHKLDGTKPNFKIFIETNNFHIDNGGKDTQCPQLPYENYLFGKIKNKFIINF